MTDSIYQKILQKIKEAKKILLVTHDAPDGDALSSVCIMIELLETFKKPFFAFCADQPPCQFDFLPNIEKIINDKEKLNFSDFDLVITLDCGNLSRTNLTSNIKGRGASQTIIEIDHHPKIDDYADIELRNDTASSTAEIIYIFLKHNKIKITKNIANCILAGVMTDTGNFLYPSTSGQTVEIASEMLSRGAKLSQIVENTWRNKSLASMKVWGKAMSRLQINRKYNLAFTILTLADMAEDNISEEELEGIAGFISNLDNVNGVLLIKEQPGGIIKGSLRTSHKKINISSLAQALGGGGHIKAAGFKIKGELEKTKNGWKII